MTFIFHLIVGLLIGAALIPVMFGVFLLSVFIVGGILLGLFLVGARIYSYFV